LRTYLIFCFSAASSGPPNEDPTCYSIDESEGTDRRTLVLPGMQQTLFDAVHAAGTPVVVFLMNAGPVDISAIKASGVPIVSGGYGGEFGGQAIVDVLTGLYNPGGALTMTVYPEEFAHKAHYYDMTMRPDAVTGNPGRGYRFTTISPLWKFGFGLSYTTFSLQFAQTPGSVIAPMQTTNWVARLVNTGERSGSIAVICYTRITSQKRDGSVKLPPKQTVFDFARSNLLNPGDTQFVPFKLSARARALTNEHGDYVNPDGTYEVFCEAGAMASTGSVKFAVQSTVSESE